MLEPGDRRPSSGVAESSRPTDASVDRDVRRPRSVATSLGLALGAGLAAAAAWALLRGILDLGIGLLAVAGVGGWAMGALLRRLPRASLVATVFAVVTWVVALVLTWVVAMAILPGSSRTFLERLAGTPFLDWQAPQFGLLEAAGLVLFIIGALYGARPRGSTGRMG